jgi:hypothetical protein
MFNLYDRVDEEEILAMSGSIEKEKLDILKVRVSLFVKIAKEKNIPLGAVQNFLGRIWREKVA